MSSKSTFSVSKNAILLASTAAVKRVGEYRQKVLNEAIDDYILKHHNRFLWKKKLFPWIKEKIVERSEVEQWLNRPDNKWEALEWTYGGCVDLEIACRLQKACDVCYEDYANLDSDDAGFVRRWLPNGESK